MAELTEARLFELYGRSQAANELLRDEIVRLRRQIVELQDEAATEPKEATDGR